jgi:hypothetical protein
MKSNSITMHNEHFFSLTKCIRPIVNILLTAEIMSICPREGIEKVTHSLHLINIVLDVLATVGRQTKEIRKGGRLYGKDV